MPNGSFRRMQWNWLVNMRDLFAPNPALMGVDIAIQVKMGVVCPQNVVWSMCVYFHPCKEFQSKRFSWSRIITLKFLKMFDFIWVKLQHFMDSFVHCTLWYILCFPFLLLTNPFLQSLPSFSLNPAVSLVLGIFLLLNDTFAKHTAHCCCIHNNI